MPKIEANGITLHYEQQGTGEPLVLIPYLAADNACYAFQVAEYAKHYTCITMDLRGTGESDKPEGSYTTETLADDVAALMTALRVERAHVAGLSLGAAIAMWVAAKYPDRVKSLSAHAAWTKTDPFLKTVVSSFQVAARALDNVPEMVIQNIFPWCFTPDLYAAKPEYMEGLFGFVRSRPAQPVASFIQQSNAVLSHDIAAHLGRITAPTLLTLGRHDQLCSTRFLDALRSGIRKSEVEIFEGCAHAPLYQSVEEFNEKTLKFLRKQS